MEEKNDLIDRIEELKQSPELLDKPNEEGLRPLAEMVKRGIDSLTEQISVVNAYPNLDIPLSHVEEALTVVMRNPVSRVVIDKVKEWSDELERFKKVSTKFPNAEKLKKIFLQRIIDEMPKPSVEMGIKVTVTIVDGLNMTEGLRCYFRITKALSDINNFLECSDKIKYFSEKKLCELMDLQMVFWTTGRSGFLSSSKDKCNLYFFKVLIESPDDIWNKKTVEIILWFFKRLHQAQIKEEYRLLHQGQLATLFCRLCQSESEDSYEKKINDMVSMDYSKQNVLSLLAREVPELFRPGLSNERDLILELLENVDGWYREHFIRRLKTIVEVRTDLKEIPWVYPRLIECFLGFLDQQKSPKAAMSMIEVALSDKAVRELIIQNADKEKIISAIQDKNKSKYEDVILEDLSVVDRSVLSDDSRGELVVALTKLIIKAKNRWTEGYAGQLVRNVPYLLSDERIDVLVKLISLLTQYVEKDFWCIPAHCTLLDSQSKLLRPEKIDYTICPAMVNSMIYL